MIQDAKARGIYTILDAKRGDIFSTMRAYGQSAYDHFDADAMTILPWMGLDVLDALKPWLLQGKGVYTVWLSSNRSGRRLQEQTISNPSETLAEYIFSEWEEWIIREGLSDQCGYVLGATSLPANVLERCLKSRKHSLLMPGVGAQGAAIDRPLKNLISQHPASLLPISRGLLQPPRDFAIESWDDYTLAVGSNLNRFIKTWQNLHL